MCFKTSKYQLKGNGLAERVTLCRHINWCPNTLVILEMKHQKVLSFEGFSNNPYLIWMVGVSTKPFLFTLQLSWEISEWIFVFIFKITFMFYIKVKLGQIFNKDMLLNWNLCQDLM